MRVHAALKFQAIRDFVPVTINFLKPHPGAEYGGDAGIYRPRDVGFGSES